LISDCAMFIVSASFLRAYSNYSIRSAFSLCRVSTLSYNARIAYVVAPSPYFVSLLGSRIWAR